MDNQDLTRQAAQPPATTGAAPPMTLKHLLDRSETAIQAILPKHMTAERLIKTALVAVNKTPKLMDCTPMSVLKATMEAAELGLDFTGNLGQAYLVPFNCKVQVSGQPDRWEMQATFMPGYRGLITLARRSGEIRSIEARLVYAGDEFVLEYGLEPKMIHRPCLDAAKRGEPVQVYAIARFKDEGVDPQCEVMTRAEVEHIRSKSKAKNASAWSNDWGEMARKTVVKRLAKYLPLSPELAKAIEIDNERFGYAEMPSFTVTQEPAPTAPGARSEILVDKIKNKGKAPEPAAEPPAPESSIPEAEPVEKPMPSEYKPDPAPEATTEAEAVQARGKKNFPSPLAPADGSPVPTPDEAPAPEINADLKWISDEVNSGGGTWAETRTALKGDESWPTGLGSKALRSYTDDELKTIRSAMGG